MKSLGETIKELREEQAKPLRTVAAYLDIDQAVLSKIEHGYRNPSREQIVKLAKYFNVNTSELIITWLADKVLYELEDEEDALKALKLAEKKIKKTF